MDTNYLVKVRIQSKWHYATMLEALWYDGEIEECIRVSPLAERAQGACPRGGVRRSPRGSGQGSERTAPVGAGAAVLDWRRGVATLHSGAATASLGARGCGRCGDDTGQCNCYLEDL